MLGIWASNWGGKGELESREETLKLKRRQANSRKRSQESDQKDYIIEMAQPSESIDAQRKRSAERPQDIVNSRNGTNQENGMRRGEVQESEMGADHPPEIEMVPHEESPKGEKSIIKPKRRMGASHLEKGEDLGRKYSLASILKSGIDDNPEANRVLLGGLSFKRMLKCTFNHLTTMIFGVFIHRVKLIWL